METQAARFARRVLARIPTYGCAQGHNHLTPDGAEACDRDAERVREAEECRGARCTPRCGWCGGCS